MDGSPRVKPDFAQTQKKSLNAKPAWTNLDTDLSGCPVFRGPQAIAGVSQQLSYSYDASGNLTRVVDVRGNATDFSYDARGNRISVRDAAGNTVTRSYGAKNELLTETVYAVPDPDGAGAGQPGSPLTTRYV